MSKVRVSPVAYVWAAVLLYLLPVKWLLCAAFAALVHELSHIFALMLLGIQVTEIRITPFGASIVTGSVTHGKELICALAGPAGSLLLLAAYRLLPEIALCAILQGGFNLLPVYPLDGGRAVRSLIYMISRKPERTVKWVERGILSIMLTVLLIVFSSSGVTAALQLFVLVIIGNVVFRKIPCKADKLALQ